DAGAALDAKVRCVWDRDLTTPDDFDQTSPFQTVTGGGGIATHTLEYTVPSGLEGSTLTLAYWVTTQLLNGNDALTDSWLWSTYTIVIGGVQTERPILLLTFDVESDDTDPSSGYVTPLTIQAISDIVALLESSSLVGTFFIQGACYDNVVSGDTFMTEVEKVMLRNEIGSHSYSHAAMGALTRSEMAFQLTDAEFALEMKLYGFRGPYFDITSDLQDELSVEEYIYDVSIWDGGESTPYLVNTPSGSLFEVPWRASDHDTSYAVLTQVIDNYVASGHNLTMVFHPQYVAADWTGFSNLISAVSDYASTSQVEVITALSAVNRVRGNNLPDLSVGVSDIYFDKPDPTIPGSTVDIKYTIHNLGGSDASNFIVRLFDGNPNSGGSQIGSDVVIAFLGPSLAMRNGAQWVATSSGQHDIYIQIDPSNSLVEIREDNNLAYRSISVVSSDPLSVSLTGSTASGTAPLLVDFAAYTSGGTAPYLCYWEFGDGDYIDWATQDTASKTYSQPGLFEARVMAKDSIGQMSDWTDPWQVSVFKSSVNPYVSELIVTTDRNIDSASIVKDITALVDFADENEIAALSILVKEDEVSGDGRIMPGQIFYLETDSEFGDIMAPGYEHVDVLQTVIEKAHEVGIKVYAWIPVFADEFALSKNPMWRLDPVNEDARQYQLERVREVLENYDVDGIRLDHLRYPTGLCLLFPTPLIAERNIEKFTSDVRDIVDDTQLLKRRDILLGAYLQGRTRSWSVCQSYSLLEPYLDDVMPLFYWQDLAFNATWPGPALPLDKNNALTDLFWRLKATFNPEETYQEWLEDWSTNVPSRYISNELNEMGDITPSSIVPVYSMTSRFDYFDVANWKSEIYWIPESDTVDFFEVSAAKSRDFGINRFALYYFGKLEGPGSIESRIPTFLASANDVMTGVLSSPTSTPPDISPFNGGWHDLIYRKTLIWLGSPANMTVTNSEDDMFGIDRGGNLYDEIAESLVSYVATNKTYILPDDCYNVRIEGLDSGEYDLVISRLNGTSVERAAFLDVPVDANTDDVVTFGCQVKEVSIMTEDDEKNFDFEVFIGDDEFESEFEATNLRIRKGETQSYDYSNVDSSDTTVEMKLDEGSDGTYEYTYTMNDGTDGGEIDYPKKGADTDLTMVVMAVIAIIIATVVSLLLLNRRRRSKPERIEGDEKARDEEEDFRET
ncbi:MAG: CARDB domain-containing protein, partial [Candidatus Thorarchaeota archaeon]